MLTRYGMNAFRSAPSGFGAGVKRSVRPFLALGGEPAIEEILADEATLQIMAKDGVGMDQLHSLMTEVRLRLV